MGRIIWVAVGFLSLGLGLIGVVLPLVPTVPFLLLAAFAFSRSSRRLHDWLLDHRWFGPPIRDWRRSGAIRRRVKWLGTASIGLTFGVSLLLGVGAVILSVQAVTLGGALLFIWTRPDGPAPGREVRRPRRNRDG